jgi:hypothetical protein
MYIHSPSNSSSSASAAANVTVGHSSRELTFLCCCFFGFRLLDRCKDAACITGSKPATYLITVSRVRHSSDKLYALDVPHLERQAGLGSLQRHDAVSELTRSHPRAGRLVQGYSAAVVTQLSGHAIVFQGLLSTEPLESTMFLSNPQTSAFRMATRKVPVMVQLRGRRVHH